MPSTEPTATGSATGSATGPRPFPRALPDEPAPTGLARTDRGVWRRNDYGWRLLDATDMMPWDRLIHEPGFAPLVTVPADFPDEPVVQILRGLARTYSDQRAGIVTAEDTARAEAFREAARIVEIRAGLDNAARKTATDGRAAAAKAEAADVAADRDTAVCAALVDVGEALGPLLASMWDGGRAYGYARGHAAARERS